MRIRYGAHDKLYTSFNIAGSILTGSSDISLQSIPNPTSFSWNWADGNGAVDWTWQVLCQMDVWPMFYAKCLTQANICFARTFKVSHCTAVRSVRIKYSNVKKTWKATSFSLCQICQFQIEHLNISCVHPQQGNLWQNIARIANAVPCYS